MMQYNDLKEYLEVKGLKGMEVQFVKSAEVEIIMAIAAAKSNGPSLKEILKNKWDTIIGVKPGDSDFAFIDSFDFKYQSYALYDNIQRRGVSKGTSKMSLEYIRSLWFFAYIGTFADTLTIQNLQSKLNEIFKQETDNGYIEPEKFYMLSSLFKKYTRYPDCYEDLKKKINKKYLSELRTILDLAISILLSDDDNGRFDELKYIFTIDADKGSTETTKNNQTTLVKASVTTKDEKEQKPKNDVKVETKTITKTDSTKKDDTVKKDKVTKAEVPQDQVQKKIKVNDRLNAELKEDKNYVQTTADIFAILEDLKSQYDLEKNIIVDAYNKKMVALEERIKTLGLENEVLSNTIEKIKTENDKARVSGAEEILSVLNSDKFSCVIDTIFKVKETKIVSESDMLNMSIQFFNALKSLGYITVQWGNKIGDIIPKGSDVIELGKKYRWDAEANIKDKDLVIVAPGLKHKASNLAVYNAKIEIKKDTSKEDK